MSDTETASKVDFCLRRLTAVFGSACIVQLVQVELLRHCFADPNPGSLLVINSTFEGVSV